MYNFNGVAKFRDKIMQLKRLILCLQKKVSLVFHYIYIYICDSNSCKNNTYVKIKLIFVMINSDKCSKCVQSRINFVLIVR